MLVGQEIGFTEVVMISLFGMAVATIAIILLMFFVIILSNIVQGKGTALAARKTVLPTQAVTAAVSSSVQAVHAAAPAASPQPVTQAHLEITEEEIAAISASLCAETGMSPNQFRIVSIISR